MAGSACGSVRVAGCCSAAVNTLRELLDLIRMTLRALGGLEFGRPSYFMDVAVAGGASRFAEQGMNALGRGLLGVAGSALDFGNFCRMRKILDGGVTVLAAEDSMNAGRVFLRMDGNTCAFFRFHIRLAVAGEAGFILFQGLRGLFLTASKSGKAETNEKNQKDKGGASRTIRMFRTSSQHVLGSL